MPKDPRNQTRAPLHQVPNFIDTMFEFSSLGFRVLESFQGLEFHLSREGLL